MACAGGPTRKQAEAEERAVAARKKSISLDQKNLMELGVLLCEAGVLIEEAGLAKKMSPKLRSWLKEHEKFEMEKTRQEALKKLTAKERRALGVR